MESPSRKHPRLKEYDYSQNGYYFITINTHQNQPILSYIWRGHFPADVRIVLTSMGVVAEQQLFGLEQRYDYVTIKQYVIMPTHIHAIIVLKGDHVAAGASPRPTLTDIVCAYKSLTTRLCNQNDHVAGRKIFQTSFYETVIRSEQNYLDICQYIDNNPFKWTETNHL